MKRRSLLRYLWLLLGGVGLAGWIRPVLAQTDTPTNLVYGLEQIELHMRINGDGTVDVVELQQVRVDEGTLFSGFQNLSLRQLDGVSGLAVEADGRLLNLDESACLYCYWSVTQPRQPDWVTYDRETFDIVFNPDAMGQVQTFWDFPGIAAGETANFLIRYQALGAIQLFPQSQRLIWDVTPGFPVPVEVARLLITPPPGLTAADLEIDAGSAAQTVDEQDRVVLEFAGPVPAETHWFVTISLPAGATSATPAQWQQELEAAVAAAETARSNAFQNEQQQYLQQARVQFVALGLTLLILIAGAILLARQNRGPETALPLQGLPPAAIPYLAPAAPAEPAAQALLAQLLALVDYGLIAPEAAGRGLVMTPAKVHERSRWEMPDGQVVRLQPAMVTSYQALAAAGPAGQPLSPAAIAAALSAQWPALVEDILGDLEEALAQTPARLVERSNRRGLGLLVLGAVSLLATALSGLGGNGWIAFAPAVALLLIGGLTYYRARLLAGAPAGPDLPTQVKQYRQSLRQLAGQGNAATVSHRLRQQLAYAAGLDELSTLAKAAAAHDLAWPAWLEPFVAAMLPLLRERLPAELADKLAHGASEALAN